METATTSWATPRTSLRSQLIRPIGNKMIIAWRQFNSIKSDFRQAGWGYTTDAGVHWTFPGVLQNSVFRSDPVTNSDEIGNFFYLSLQSDGTVIFLR